VTDFNFTGLPNSTKSLHQNNHFFGGGEDIRYDLARRVPPLVQVTEVENPTGVT
jgi:hypothetical protein